MQWFWPVWWLCAVTVHNGGGGDLERLVWPWASLHCTVQSSTLGFPPLYCTLQYLGIPSTVLYSPVPWTSLHCTVQSSTLGFPLCTVQSSTLGFPPLYCTFQYLGLPFTVLYSPVLWASLHCTVQSSTLDFPPLPSYSLIGSYQADRWPNSNWLTQYCRRQLKA